MGGFTVEMLIIAVVRVAGSLPVLRWALVGAIIAVLTDFSDLFMMNVIDLGGVTDYQSFDKYLDQVYMAAFLVVALRWRGFPRTVAVALYLFRMAGFVAFEVSGNRSLLPFFPNLFEFWFIFVAAVLNRRGAYNLSPRASWAWLSALLGLKLAQEYVIHGARLLDSFTAVEAVQAIWRWVTAPFRR
ncbi:MAG: hypothetical protein U0531_12725 [Dehalococcoidia bacterium]